ncbi:MAG: tripartite tricarboxylate transporter TctB family protein [Elstera sp.]
MVQLKAPQDLLAGVFLTSLGILGLVYGAGLSLGGKVSVIGPGYLPRLLSFGLLGFGSVLMVRAWVLTGEGMGRVPVRRVAAILGALLTFALLIEPAGLVVATLTQVFIAWLASPEKRWREGVALSLGLALGALLLFGFALQLPLKLWPV